jgi:hypothetical protein
MRSIEIPPEYGDLIDEASSRVRMYRSASPPSLKEAMKGLESLQRELDSAVSGQEFELAADLRDRERKLQRLIADLEANWKEEQGSDVPEVNEEDIPNVSVGQSALLHSDAFRGRALRAEVDSITPKGDPVAKTYRVRLALPEDTPLMIGMSADVNIVVRVAENTLLIPSLAIENGAVFVVESGVARRRSVETGIRGVRAVEILSGLAEDLAQATRAGFEYILEKHAKAAAVRCPTLIGRPLSPHLLRHSCAVLMLQATRDIRKVALWLGHADIRTTEVYLRMDPTEKLEAVEAVLPPALRRGRFKAPPALIVSLMADVRTVPT